MKGGREGRGAIFVQCESPGKKLSSHTFIWERENNLVTKTKSRNQHFLSTTHKPHHHKQTTPPQTNSTMHAKKTNPTNSPPSGSTGTWTFCNLHFQMILKLCSFKSRSFVRLMYVSDTCIDTQTSGVTL